MGIVRSLVLVLSATASGCVVVTHRHSHSPSVPSVLAAPPAKGLVLTWLKESHSPDWIEYTWHFESDKSLEYTIKNPGGSSTSQGPGASDPRALAFRYSITYRLEKISERRYKEVLIDRSESIIKGQQAVEKTESKTEGEVDFLLVGKMPDPVTYAAEAQQITPGTDVALLKIETDKGERTLKVRFKG